MARDHVELTRWYAGRSSVVAVRGAVDCNSCRRLSATIGDALDAAPARLVIDLCGVELVDSMSLAVLVDTRRRALRHGVELRLVCDVPSALQVLALTGLDRAFDIYRTNQAALEDR